MNKRAWLIVAVSLLVSVLATTGCSLPRITLFGDKHEPLREYVLEGTDKGKVLLLSIDGTITDREQERLLRSRPSTVQQVVAYLKNAEKDPEIGTLLLKINSPGGTVTASDILYHEISAYKARTGVKIVVIMMNVATSGGYYIALPADHIMAHPTTITGSIGVIFARPGVSGLMEKTGFSVEVSKSGERKDMGSPFRPPTETEGLLFQELTDALADRFLGLVDRHRQLEPEQLIQIAEAGVYLPDQAMALGLVDQIGYLDDAIVKARQIAGLSPDARVVAYRRTKIEDDTLYHPAIRHQGGDLEALLPFLAPLSSATGADFYYVWPAAFGH
jgi:protease-4